MKITAVTVCTSPPYCLNYPEIFHINQSCSKALLSASLHRYVRRYRIRQNSRGGKLLRFSRFLLNCRSFPIKYFTRLGIHYYKKFLSRKFSHRIFIFVLTVKVFPLECFVVYGTCTDTSLHRYIHIYVRR